MRRRLWLPFVLCFTSALGAGCDRQAPDLREWRVSDHDHTTDPGANQVEGGPDAGVSAELAAHGLNEVVLVTWEQNCVRCHGRFGRGDGPQGPMVRAADLSNQRWQATATDEGIFNSIKSGKGLMPAFPLPDTTVRALVQLVRLLGQAAAPAAGDTEDVPAAAHSGAAHGAAQASVPGAHPGVTAAAKSAATTAPHAPPSPVVPAPSAR